MEFIPCLSGRNLFRHFEVEILATASSPPRKAVARTRPWKGMVR